MENNEKQFWIFILSAENVDPTVELTALPVTSLEVPDLRNAKYTIESLSYSTFSIISCKQIKVNHY
jgi:hypothetical protein